MRTILGSCAKRSEAPYPASAAKPYTASGFAAPTAHRWVRGAYGSPMIYNVRARGKLEKERAGKPAAKILEVAALIAQRASELETFLEAQNVLTPP